jgi:hypothetical protein
METHTMNPSASPLLSPHRAKASFNDLAWNTQLDQVIQSNDLGNLWPLVDSHIDEDEAHRQMVNRIARLAYQVRRRTYFAEMFAMPVIVPGGSDVLENQEGWKQASDCIEDTLVQWLPKDVHPMMFQGLRTYDHIGAWQPTVIRQHLLRAVPGHRPVKLRYQVQALELPQEAPRLAFITMLLTSKTGWPRCQRLDPVADMRLRQICAFALHYGRTVPAPMVLPPDRFQFAVRDGLLLWLQHLHQNQHITGWHFHLYPKSPDVVGISFKLAEHAPCSEFTIRQHMLGKQGLGEIFRGLKALAPCLEQPMDRMSAEHP